MTESNEHPRVTADRMKELFVAAGGTVPAAQLEGTLTCADLWSASAVCFWYATEGIVQKIEGSLPSHYAGLAETYRIAALRCEATRRAASKN